jgi:anaerobic selenocysteine-containing dehydrogenase
VEFVDEHSRRHQDAGGQGEATGDYKIPKIIYADAYRSEMVAYADLVLPDTTYLERHDCISLLDRPISEPDAVQDAIRWPVLEPDRDVRGFQSVLIDLGVRLGSLLLSTVAARQSMPILPTTSFGTSGGRASAAGWLSRYQRRSGGAGGQS